MNTSLPNWHRLLWLAGTAGLTWAAAADTLEKTWSIAPGERSYVTTGNTERGLAVNPATKSVLLVGRAGSPQVYVLRGTDGADGSAETGEPRKLSLSDADGNPLVTGGLFPLNLAGVGTDGAVYACNMTTDTVGNPFKVYRWANENPETPVTVAFAGDAAGGKGGTGQDIRFGDNFAVRGSGATAQLAAMSRNGKYLTILTTTDGTTFTATTLTTDASGKGGVGLAFGEGNTIWSKINGQALILLDFNLAAGTATTVRTIPNTVVANGVTGIAYDPTIKRFAATDYSAHTFAVFDFSDLAAPTRIGDVLPMPATPPVANGNGTAAAAVAGDDVVGLDTNNGVIAAKVKVSTVVEPPGIDTAPVAQTVLVGGSVQLGVVAHGSKPLTYQWKFNGADLAGQTGASLTLANVTLAQDGEYSVVVRNTAGEATSDPARLTVVPLVESDALTLLWQLAPGAKPWLNTDSTQRGLAYNPANGHVLVVGRSAGNQVYVLDGQTGQELHALTVDPGIVFGGTYPVNLVAVGDDGAVYVCNLTTDGAASAFNVYRWINDAADTLPELVYSGDPGGGRWGDTFDVRGAGTATQFLAAQRNGKAVAVFGTTDGAQFTPTLIPVEDATLGNFGLGAVFGPGNTFFGKATGQTLRQVSFDLAAGTGTTLQNYTTGVPGGVGPIGWDPVNNFLAGVTFENPDTTRLYDLADPENPTLIDQQFSAGDNANINGTGAADFGGNRLFVLNSNNGLQAFTVKKPTPAAPPTLTNPVVSGGNLAFTINGVAGATYGIQVTADFKTWSDVAGVTVPGPSGQASVPVVAGAAQCFRAVAK
jgi:WD40 repeat protein